jgi:hypothetical protein
VCLLASIGILFFRLLTGVFWNGRPGGGLFASGLGRMQAILRDFNKSASTLRGTEMPSSIRK